MSGRAEPKNMPIGSLERLLSELVFEERYLCLANYYSRSDWRVEKALAMLLPSVGIKRSAGGTRFTRLLLWGVPT